MKKYTDIDIKYIQRKIEITSWEDHQYIDNLVLLANYIENSPNGYSANMHYNSLKFLYPSDYLFLLEEIDPIRYEKELVKIKQEDNQKDSLIKEQALIEEAYKNDWKEAGGKI